MGAGCSKQIYYFTFLKSTGKKKNTRGNAVWFTSFPEASVDFIA